MPKYTESFDTPHDEIPQECPICKHDFNLSEDVQTNPVKNGYKSILYCPKCNFKKILSFDTDEDVEREMNEEDIEDNDDDYEEDIEDNDEDYE